MTDTILRELIWEKIENDFDKFDFSDKPMQKLFYHRTKHIQMATQIVMNVIELGDYVSMRDIDDLVHGLNHLFFNGVAAGQSFAWFKEKEKN
jgi:hypothetical protein